MSASVVSLAHPVHAALQRLADAVEEVAGFNPVFLSAQDKARALVELTRMESQVAAARAQVLAVATDLAEADGARDPGAWLSAHGLVDPKKAHAAWKLAQELETRPDLAAAVTAGQISLDHARVIIAAVDQLPPELPLATITAAQDRLVAEASRFRPVELRRLGAHILEVIAPHIAEEAEAKRLLELEAAAEAKTSLRIHPLGDGTTKVDATVPDHIGHRLTTMVQAYAQPRISALQAEGRTRPRTRIMGEAFATMLETMDPHRVPLHGGDATTLIVTIDLDQLRHELGHATLHDTESTGSTGAAGGAGATGGEGTAALTRLSAAQARRLACAARIIPAVLGGPSEPLDLGRTRRLFTPAQRKALKLRDHGCRAENCTVPPTWCEAHHTQPWSHGGPTNLDNALLLCSHHHHRAHDPNYDTTHLPNGQIRFHRRT